MREFSEALRCDTCGKHVGWNISPWPSDTLEIQCAGCFPMSADEMEAFLGGQEKYAREFKKNDPLGKDDESL